MTYRVRVVNKPDPRIEHNPALDNRERWQSVVDSERAKRRQVDGLESSLEKDLEKIPLRVRNRESECLLATCAVPMNLRRLDRV